ncbi:MAG TPA: 23S rRNA (adenine(2503)-C(2))-methyltransferase RlmN [Gemmatimonadales bacterium]|nr:23S rRNA (adenine(2503)-C(2))-methyltransferase RlmN [Gemmatimonadales bacterium]
MASNLNGATKCSNALPPLSLGPKHRGRVIVVFFSMANPNPAPQPSRNLLDLSPSLAETLLRNWVAERGLPAYRVGQIHRRLWEAPVRSWTEATDLPATLRTELQEAFPLQSLVADTIQQSEDGTRKYLWRLHDAEAIESVLIPTGTRRTLCISSQAGCALGCTFCATGRMGFRRNLSAFEIAGQVREVILRTPADKPTNIVFMGMGEPLLNWPAVDTALTVLNSPKGFGIGARHITVSTVGILPGMAEFAKRPEQFRLAISLHAPTTSQRIGIMPIEKKYDLESVLKAAEAFKKRITFEYVMIAGVNDSDADADNLARHARRMGALVNILPLHPGGAPDLRPTTASRIRSFADRLRHQGIEAVVRRSRGLDINAACGQLRVEVERKRRGARA